MKASHQSPTTLLEIDAEVRRCREQVRKMHPGRRVYFDDVRLIVRDNYITIQLSHNVSNDTGGIDHDVFNCAV